jgi:hypothetical protein
VKLIKGETTEVNLRELLHKDDLKNNVSASTKPPPSIPSTVSVAPSQNNSVDQQMKDVDKGSIELSLSQSGLNTSQGELTDSLDASFDDPTQKPSKNRITSVIEKIERMYAGEKEIFEGYDTEDSFIDDSDMVDLEVCLLRCNARTYGTYRSAKNQTTNMVDSSYTKAK